MSQSYLLTKSKYIRGLQCERAMYLDVFKPKLARYSKETLEKFRHGREFEHQFKNSFPNGIDISSRLRFKMDRYPVLTAQLLQQAGEVALFEAGFIYDEVLVLADVVHKQEDGQVTIYEVKNGLKVSDTFRNDVAIQHYVIAHALPNIVQPSLFRDPLELQHFYVLYNDGEGGFVKEEQLPYARSQWDAIAGNVAQFKQTLRTGEPAIPMSTHCDTPYECPYKHYCLRLK